MTYYWITCSSLSNLDTFDGCLETFDSLDFFDVFETLDILEVFDIFDTGEWGMLLPALLETWVVFLFVEAWDYGLLLTLP